MLTSIAKQRLQLELLSVSAETNTLTTAASETQVVTTETEALTVRIRGSEYVSSRCIAKQEVEGFNRVFCLQSAKDLLKRMYS
jgi:hypothetical protein